MKTGVTIKQHEIKRIPRVVLRLEEAVDEMSWGRPWEIRQTLKGLLCMRRRARRLSENSFFPHVFFFFPFSNKTRTRPFPAILTSQTRAGARVGDEEPRMIQRWGAAECCRSKLSQRGEMAGRHAQMGVNEFLGRTAELSVHTRQDRNQLSAPQLVHFMFLFFQLPHASPSRYD